MIGLSFIGTGDYKETIYKFGEKTYKTSLMPLAIKEFFQVERLFIVQTEEAKQKHGNTLKASYSYTPIDIPSGKNSNELWQMFSKIAEAIPENATLIVDTTHGFRSQPMIALSIMMYLQAAKNVKVKRIVYGAFEAKENDITPVFDLTPFLDIMNWASATNQLLKFGDASSMKNQLRQAHRETYFPDSPFRALRLSSVGDKLERLTNALSLVRPKEVLKNAMLFSEELQKAKPDFENIIAAKPFAFLLEKVKEKFEAYSKTKEKDLFKDDGFTAQANMIDFYIQTEQYQQAILLGRESIVSKICVIEKLNPLKREERMRAEDLLRQWCEPIRNNQPFPKQLAPFEDIAKLWDKITNIRNDIAHAGMNEQASESGKLIERIKRTNEEIKKYICSNQS